MKKVLLFALVILWTFGAPFALAQASTPQKESYKSAMSAKLLVAPENIETAVGKDAVVTIILDPNKKTICSVKGELYVTTDTFGSPYIKKVTAAKEITAHGLPTGSRSSFFLTIPNCTKEKIPLMTVELGSHSSGKAVLSFGNVVLINKEGKPALTETHQGQYIALKSAPKTTAALSAWFSGAPTAFLLIIGIALALFLFTKTKSYKKISNHIAHMGILHELVSRENKRYKFQVGKTLASSLAGFIGGAIFASIIWYALILWIAS